MPLGAPEDFSADEQQILKTLEQTDPELQAETPAPASAPAAATPSEQASGEPGQTTAQGQPAEAAAPNNTQADDKATNAEPPQPTGDVRQALRASRRAERQARERAERLEAELAELRSRVPAEPNPDEITEDELREVEESMPFIAKIARRVIGKEPAQKEQATTTPATAPSPPPVAEVVQDAIDDTPELLAWQSSQDQARFQAAIEMDKYLSTLPAWKDKPLSERFQEVVKRVKADRGELTTQPNNVPAGEIERAKPSTLTDIGGAGQAPNSDPLRLERMAKMSDEDIVAGLLRQGG